MYNYRMTIQYDGTRYKGWQIQKNTDMTIQGKLQAVLASIAGYPVEVIGSGRTDAGVHAVAQVANFHLKNRAAEQELLEQINHFLPEDIAVMDIRQVSERFHSRYHAIKKTYRYRIHTSRIPNVFERKYVYTYTEGLDVERMRQGAALLSGTHDFKSFCGNRHMKKSTVRTIYSIAITRQEHEILIDYTGDGFLQNMVRIMTGTLIEIGNGSRLPQEVTGILAARNRDAAGYTAPAQGLSLLSVQYE